jgi:hypothetical protein
MKPAALISEARARIVWGEPPSSVRDFLTAHGISDIDADAKLNELIAERNSEIRKIGIKNTIIGAALTLGACVFLYLSFKHVDVAKMSSGSARGFVTIALVIAIGGFYGIWKLIDGISCIVRPQSEEKAISEVSE